MSARILYSLTDEKSGGGAEKQQHIGCMNGIFHLFDRGHFLSGGRRPTTVTRKRLTAGQDGNCDAEEDTVSIKSTGEVPKAVAKDRHRLSSDSSRSSASSTCYSSSFSSSVEENNRLAKMEPLPTTMKPREQSTKYLPRLLRGNNSLPKSGAMTYVDSPRPVLLSKVREKNAAMSASLRDLPSLQRPRSFVDSSRLSYDERESRDVIKSNAMKFKEQPRHSLDSKWQSSVVAKLMGLEAAPDAQASSKPRTVHCRNNSVNALDPFTVSSRTGNEYKREPSADLVVRLKSNASQVLEKVALATKESPLPSPSASVYGELEKRLEQIEFRRTGKDLQALKQILEAMQKSKQQEDDRKNIHRVVTETSNGGKSDFAAKFAVCSSMKPACSANPRGTQRNSSDQQRSDSLPPRLSSKCASYMNRSSESTHSTGEHRHIVESNCTGRNQGNLSARPLKSKKSKLADSPRRSNQTVRQPREPASPLRAVKSKVSHDLIISNAGSAKSDDDASLMSLDDDSEVSSYHVMQEEQMPKKVQLLQSEVSDDSPLKLGIIQAEQPSPVSVLDPTYLEDELLSPVKLMSEDFKDGKSTQLCRRARGLDAPAEMLPDKKHDHMYILQTPNAGSLMTIQLRPSGTVMANLFPTVAPDKQSNNFLMGQPHPKCGGERIHRKLLFDVMDEIMVQKLLSDNNHRDRFSLFSAEAKKTGQEQLLQGLCCEIAHLRANNYKYNIDNEDGDYIKAVLRRDMEGKSQSWNGCLDDSGIVLDIERSIYKDLVTEVVTGEAVVLRNSLTSYCRLMASV